MAVLGEIFDQGQPLTEFKIELYFKSLMDYGIDAIEKAASNIIKGRVYPAFPKPAEIINEIDGLATERALLAWNQVLEGMRRVGQWQSVKFSDPVIHSAVESMGGWEKICYWDDSELAWKQKEFERLYAIAEKQGGVHPEYLPGIHEMKNGLDGKPPQPVLIGSTTAAVRTAV